MEDDDPDPVEFDLNFYCEIYTDIQPEFAAEHYRKHGWREGRSPNANFSAQWYLEHYPEVGRNGIEPWVHFASEGKTRGLRHAPYKFWEPKAWRPEHGGVDPEFYRARYKDLPADVDPAEHYADIGWNEGRDPNPDFSTSWYLGTYPDIAADGINPLHHYLMHGYFEGRKPKPITEPAEPSIDAMLPPETEAAQPDGFDLAFYKETYTDILPEFVSEHYRKHGWREGRSPNANFSAQWYLEHYPEVGRNGIEPWVHFASEGKTRGLRHAPYKFWEPKAWRPEHGGVDPEFYRARYKDLPADVDPAEHYADIGWNEGRDPNPDFSTSWYLGTYPDIAADGINPLHHYLMHGYFEGRKPKPITEPAEPSIDAMLPPETEAAQPDGFDLAFYKETYTDILPEFVSEHYRKHGWREGRSPNANFSAQWYLEHYPEVGRNGIEPWVHFASEGKTRGLRHAPYKFWEPKAWRPEHGGVDPEFYRARYKDLPADVDPAEHYADIGWNEGRDPNPDFSTSWYLGTYPDIAADGINPLHHYLMHGYFEGRKPKPITEPAEPSIDAMLPPETEAAQPDGFDLAFYKETYTDILPEFVSEHYRKHGWREGRSPNANFSAQWYLEHYPEVGRNGIEPWVHFASEGKTRGLRHAPYKFWEPKAWRPEHGGVDPEFYRARYKDLPADVDPAEHYADIGWNEGRDPNPDFSTSWYLGTYPDIAADGINPLHHYLMHGYFEGRKPKPITEPAEPSIDAMLPPETEAAQPDGFDLAFYKETYTDILPEFVSEHYRKHGWREGRSPNANFSAQWYLEHYPEVGRNEIEPWVHFASEGKTRGLRHAPYKFWEPKAWRPEHGGVDPEFYRARYKDLPADVDPAEHYADIGWNEGRDPNPDFSTSWYLGTYPDIAADGINPLHHYLMHGYFEGRKPKPTLGESIRLADWYPGKIAAALLVFYATALRVEVPLFSVLHLLALSLLAILVGAAFVSIINDVTDRADDQRAGKLNRLQGRSPRRLAVMLACCIMPGLAIAAFWRNDPVVLGFYLAAWASFSAYSIPPLRLKTRGLSGALADACGAHMFPSLFLAASVVHWTGKSAGDFWLPVIGAWSFCVGMRGILCHQLIDLVHDARIGARSFAQVAGDTGVRQLTRWVIFPIEIVAFSMILFLLCVDTQWYALIIGVFLVLYLVIECCRQHWTSNIVVLAPILYRPMISFRLLLFPFYEIYLPVAVLLTACILHPIDSVVLIIHACLFSRLQITVEIKSWVTDLVLFFYPPLPTFDRVPTSASTGS